MKARLSNAVLIVVATGLAAVLIYLAKVRREDDEPIAAPATTNEVVGAEELPNALQESVLPEEAGNGKTIGEAIPGATNVDVPSWPADIEGRIWEYFAHRNRSDIVNITSVECTDTVCTIEFSGTDVSPRSVDEFNELSVGMHRQDWGVRQSSLATREIAPGARAFVIQLSNVPVGQVRPSSTSDTRTPD